MNQSDLRTKPDKGNQATLKLLIVVSSSVTLVVSIAWLTENPTLEVVTVVFGSLTALLLAMLSLRKTA